MKFNISAICTATILLTACGSKQTNVNSDSIGIQVNESDSVEITVNDSDVYDSIPAYYSDDLKKFGLHGKVKSVKTKDYSSFVTCLAGPLTFNEQGELTTKFTDLTDNETACNPDGFINETKCRESDGTTFELELTNFDIAGNPIAGKYESEGPEEIWKVTFSITYLDFDRENNWTKRVIKGEASTQSMNEDGDYGRPQKEAFEATETRTIAYY